MRAFTLVVFVLALAVALTSLPALANGYETEPQPQPQAAPPPPAQEEVTTTTTTETTTVETQQAQPMQPGHVMGETAQPGQATTTMMTADCGPLVNMTISRFYGIDQTTMSQLTARGYSTHDLAILGNMSARTGRPITEFVQLHDQGMTWASIAQRYNVAMSDVMMPATMMAMAAVSPEVESYNRQFVRQYFGLSETDIASLRNQGMNWADIYMAANLSARTNRPVTEIASWRNQGLTWTEIGSRYNVVAADISRPFVPTGRVAGIAVPVSPMFRGPIMDRSGRIILTESDSERFRAMGYDWRSIAIAANISMRTGESVGDLLRQTDRGMTWPMIAREHGLNPNDVVDVGTYPFRRDEPLVMTPEQRQMQLMQQQQIQQQQMQQMQPQMPPNY